MPFITKVTLPSGNTYDFGGHMAKPIKSTQASNTNVWTGTADFATLVSGMTIAYLLQRDSNGSNVTLNLTLSDGSTTTGAKNVYFKGGTRLTDEFSAGSTILMTYYAAGDISINGTATVDDRWVCNNYTDEGKTYTFTSGSGSNASFQVTESGGSAQTIKVADVSTTVTQNEDKLITSGAVQAAIDALPEPMVFKGTVGDTAQNPTVLWSNLPAAATANTGWTYKVVTAHATAPICIIGDVITSNGTEWVVIPSGDDPGTTDTWRNIIVNGTEVLGSAINTGGLDFIDGTNTQVSFNSTGNKISINVPETKTHLSASASGTTVNAPTSGAVTALPSTNTTDTFVQSYPGATSKLTTTSVTGVQASTTTASKATAGTAVSVATTDTAVTAITGATVSNEILSFTTSSIVPAKSNGTITPYTFTDVTVPIKNTNATTVATGAVASGSAGATVMTGLGTPTTASAITALGTPTTGQFVTGVTVSAQPTITISSGATGDVEVVTDIGPSA